MALTQYKDSIGNDAWKDSSGNVYTQGGTNKTGYNVDTWNTRQLSKNGSSVSSGSNGNSNFSSILDSAIKQQQKAYQPSIDSLKNSIGSTNQTYDTRIGQLQAQQQPLEDRYKSLISDIKGNQTQAENRQTLTTNNELGKRGISGDSGIAQQEITDAVNPITQQYTSLFNQANQAQSADINDLQNQITNTGLDKQNAINAINQAIAQLQSGGNANALQQAQSQYGQNLQQQAQSRADALQQQIYSTISLPQSQASIANINSEIANRNQAANQPTLMDFLTNPTLMDRLKGWSTTGGNNTDIGSFTYG